MSVTFFAGNATILAFQVGCYCPDAARWDATDYQDAQRLVGSARANNTVFDGCSEPGFCEPRVLQITDCDDAPEVNVSNSNARTILEALGIDTSDGLCGEMPADLFLGSALLADALTPADAGVPAHHSVDHNGQLNTRVIDCGRPAGYMQDRLAQLAELARWCGLGGRPVVWG